MIRIRQETGRGLRGTLTGLDHAESGSTTTQNKE